jgi:hypothetical protein
MDEGDKCMIYEKYLKNKYEFLKILYNHHLIKYNENKNLEDNIKLIYVLMTMKFIYYSYNLNKIKLSEIYYKLNSMYRNLKSINELHLANKLKEIANIVKHYLRSKKKMIHFYFNTKV